VSRMLDLLFTVVGGEDAALRSFIARSGVQPYFSLPWVLTWFAHSVASFECVCRMFDLFVVSDCSMPLFVSAAVVLWARAPALQSVDCEYSAVHSFYSKLFSDIPLKLNVQDPVDAGGLAERFQVDIEKVLVRAVKLREKYAFLLTSEEAREFVGAVRPDDNYLTFEHVPLPAIPKASVKHIASFQYQFEGVRKARAMERTGRTVRLLLVAIVVALVMRMMWWWVVK
jgi:hypothetical protein